LFQAYLDALTNGTTSENDAVPTTSQKLYAQLKTYSSNDILFSCFIALISAFIGGILFFPSFRLARLHFLCLKYSPDSKTKKFLFYLNFLMPLTVSLCWFKRASNSQPIANVTTNATSDTVSQFLNAIVVNSSSSSNQTSSKQFVYNILMANNLSVYLIMLVFILRIALYKEYAQAYLNIAFELASRLRQTSNKITNTKYITTISSIYQYYGVMGKF
jgi:hypothetical protein